MDLDRPYSLVTSSLDGPVLQALLTVEHLESGAEIHRRAGTGSAHGVRKVLQRLVGLGIAEAIGNGNVVYYRLNRRHIAYPAITAIGDLGPVLAQRLGERLRRWPGLRHASLFPLGTTGEVVTVLVVFDDLAAFDGPALSYSRQVLGENVRIWSGNELRFEALTVNDIVERRNAEVHEWQRENLLVAGAPLAEIP